MGEGPVDGREIGIGPFSGMSQMIGWQEEELCGTFCGCSSMGGLSLSSFTCQSSDCIWSSTVMHDVRVGGQVQKGMVRDPGGISV